MRIVGLQNAEKHGVKGRVIQSKSGADYIPNLQACVKSGAGITIGVGFLMTDAMDAIATSFPNEQVRDRRRRRHVMKHKPKNVQGLLFKEQEAGYLVGYAAGLWAKATGGTAVGSVGGLKIPPVDRYIAGYQFGAKKADPGIKVAERLLAGLRRAGEVQGEGAEPDRRRARWSSSRSPASAASVSSTQRTEKKVFGIGVDADQGYLGPQVMTSALKKVDVAGLLRDHARRRPAS